jgi:hypothetical protein
MGIYVKKKYDKLNDAHSETQDNSDHEAEAEIQPNLKSNHQEILEAENEIRVFFFFLLCVNKLYLKIPN